MQAIRYLRNNNLTSLGGNLFDGLSQLQIVFVNRMHLNICLVVAYLMLPTNSELQGNQIAEIAETTFSPLPPSFGALYA